MKKAAFSFKSLAPAIERIERLSKLQRALIYFGTVLVLVGAFIYFAYLPKYKQIGALKSDINKLEKKLISARKNAENLNEYRSQMKAAEAQYQIAKQALPDEKEIPTLLNGISMAARDAGLEIVTFQPKPEIQKDFFAEVPIDIQVTGSYHNVAVFFDMIAGLPRIVNIGSIKIVPRKDGMDLTTSCTAVTYQFVDAAKVGAADSKKKKK